MDLQKETAIKAKGPYVQLPNITILDSNMEKTAVTKEPIIDLKNEKVILD